MRVLKGNFLASREKPSVISIKRRPLLEERAVLISVMNGFVKLKIFNSLAPIK